MTEWSQPDQAERFVREYADPILRDNRKNRPRFLVICLVCLLGGAALGYAAAALTDPDAFAQAARAAGRLAAKTTGSPFWDSSARALAAAAGIRAAPGTTKAR